MPNDLLPLYQAASQKFNVGSYENFQSKMKDPKLRKSFYDAAARDFNLPDYDKFSSKVDSALRLTSTSPVDTKSLGPSANLGGATGGQQGDKLTSTPNVTPVAPEKKPAVPYPQKPVNAVDKEPTDQSMVQKAKNLITDYFAGWVPSVPEQKMQGAAPVGQFPSGNKQIAIAKKNIIGGSIEDTPETRDKLVGLGVMHEEVLKAQNTNFLKEIINQPASNTFYGQQYRLPTQIDSFLKPRAEILDNLNKVYADTSFIRPIQSKYDSIFQRDPEYVALNKSLEAEIQNIKVEASKTFDLSSAEGNANAQNFVRQKGAELNQIYNAEITDLWQSKYFTPFKTEIEDAFNLKIDAVISPSKTILGGDYIRKAQSVFESPEFQGKSYEEKKKLMDHAWQNKAIELHNAGVSPDDIFEARKQFYYHVVRPAYITDKGNLTTFSLRSYAEQTLPEIDKQLAELKKELNLARNDGIQKNGSLSNESIDKYKEYRLLLQTRENLAKIGTLPENYQGWFYQGAINKRMTDFIPFIKSIADIPDNVNLLSIKNKVRDGKTLSPIETLLLQSETAKNDIESQITPNYWYTAGQITTGMFPYIGEFAATSGIYSSAKTIVGQGLQKIATKAGTSILDLGKISAAQSAKSAGTVIFAESAAGRSGEALASLIGGIAQTAANPQMYINTTLERMQPGMVMAFSPEGTKLLYQLDESQKGRGEDFSTAFAKAFGTSWAEFATERIGEVVPWIGDTFSKKVLNDPDFMKRLTVGYWLARHGIEPNEAIQEIFKHNLSYSNIIGEQFEEWVNSPLSNIITGDQGVFEGYNKEFFATTALGIGAFAPIASVGSFLPKAKSTVRYFDVNQNPVAVNISNGKLGQLYALRNAGVMSIRDFRKKNLGKFAAGDERIYAEQVLNAFETRATAKKVGAPGMNEAEVAMKVNRYKNIPAAHASALLAELNRKIKEQTNVAAGMPESQTVPIIDVVPPVIGIDIGDPIEHIPVDIPFPEDDLDEELIDQLEDIKKEITPGTENKNKAKLSVIGNKEFISVENIEYEVKKSKSGSIIFENSVSGKEVDRRSPIYDKIVSGYLVEKYSSTTELDVSDINNEEDYYHKLGSEGDNPLEILIGAAYTDEMEGGSLQFSDKERRMADAHISFNNEDVRRYFGYDLSDLPNWQALRDNYYGKNAKGIDQSVADINLSEDHDRFTEDDLWDFMLKYPNGLDESKLFGPLTSRLGQQFTAITGIQFDRTLLKTFAEYRKKASQIPSSEQEDILAWLDDNPDGTIEELTLEVPLTDETKTLINEITTEETKGETGQEQQGGAGTTEDEAQHPEAKTEKEINDRIDAKYDSKLKTEIKPHEEIANQLSGVESFETSQGSIYTVLPDGRTERFKTVTGEKNEPQDLIVFPKFKDIAQEQRFLEGVQRSKESGTKVYVLNPDGKVARKNSELKQGARLVLVDKDGKFIESAETSLSPKIGHATYDSRTWESGGETYTRRHIGNDIVKINKKSTKDNQPKDVAEKSKQEEVSSPKQKTETNEKTSTDSTTKETEEVSPEIDMLEFEDLPQELQDALTSNEQGGVSDQEVDALMSKLGYEFSTDLDMAEGGEGTIYFRKVEPGTVSANDIINKARTEKKALNESQLIINAISEAADEIMITGSATQSAIEDMLPEDIAGALKILNARIESTEKDLGPMSPAVRLMKSVRSKLSNETAKTEIPAAPVAPKAEIPSEVDAAMDEFGDLFDDLTDDGSDIVKNMFSIPYVTDEKEKRFSFIAKLKALDRELSSGELDPKEFSIRLARLLDENFERNQSKRIRDRKRGPVYVKERILNAQRKGEITQVGAEFALWLLNKNPLVASDLGISIVTNDYKGMAGTYSPFNRLVRIIKSGNDPYVIVHEIMHHTERMLSDEAQVAIYKEWKKQFDGQVAKATPERRMALLNLHASTIFNDKDIQDQVFLDFLNGVLKRDDYQYANPSEFWAMNASEYLGNRFISHTVWQKIKAYYQELIEAIKKIFRLPNYHAVIKGMREVLRSSGEYKSKSGLVERFLRSQVRTKGALNEKEIKLADGGYRMVETAVKSGMTSFDAIVAGIRQKFGDQKAELMLPYLKRAYLSYQADAPQDVYDKLDDPTKIRNFKLPTSNETEPTISGNTTVPDSGSGNVSTVPTVQQPGLFDGTVPETETEKGAGGSGKSGANNKGGNGKKRNAGKSSGGSDNEGDTLPKGPVTDSDKSNDANLGGNDEQNPKPPRSVLTPEQRNFVITPETVIVPSGETAKIRANIAAIKLLKHIESENRLASVQEKQTLAQFVGWGGIATVFDTAKANLPGATPWKTKYQKYFDELKSILTPQEWAATVSSTINAHYTPRTTIDQMWNIARQLGFSGGKVLESSAGIGHIIGLMPQDLLPNVNVSMVELDSISGRIAKLLYPESSVQVTGFEDAKLNPNSYDLSITNVPFDQHAPFDKLHPDLTGFALHNYFMAKSMRMVKPGGIGIFISTARSLDDGASAAWREYMSAHEEVDFIGAIKLPNSAQEENAGTQVTTDIIIFQKRVQAGKVNPVAQPWVRDVLHSMAVGKNGDQIPITVNEYFKEHPEMMLGEMHLAHEVGKGGLYSGDDQTLQARPGIPLGEQIAAAAANLPKDITSYVPVVDTNPAIFTEEGDREGTYVLGKEGKSYFVENGERVPVNFANEEITFARGKKARAGNIISNFVQIKDAVRKLRAAEMDVATTDEQLDEYRSKLRRLYTQFVERYGVMNRNGKISFLTDDSEYMLVYSLEELRSRFTTDKAGRVRAKVEVFPSDILYKRVNHPYIVPDKASNIEDAVNLSVIFHGNIDLDYISSLLGDIGREDARRLTLEERLGFEDPQTGEIIEKDTYLSGNVRAKLNAAQRAMEDNPRYQANYEALLEVQPKDIPMRLIQPSIGSGWIPVSVYEKFFESVMGKKVSVAFNPQLRKNAWSLKVKGGAQASTISSTVWGILGYDGVELALYAMNQTDVVVRDPVPGEKGKYQKNPQKTEAVNNKIDDIKQEFVKWIKETEELHEQIEKEFNEKQNNYTEFQNSRTIERFPGQAEVIGSVPFKMLQHQGRAVLRALRQAVLLAHQVGSGKTYTLITTAMEMKRLKLANKPMLVVWNETLEQFTKSAHDLYPGAKILSPTKNQMDAKNRQRLIASIVYGDWDMIIIPHSFLKFIPNDPQREIDYLLQRIQALEDIKQGADEYAVSDIQKEIDSIQEAIAKKGTKKVKDTGRAQLGITKRVKKQLSSRKDATFNFEETGIDALLIDEADAFKKIGFETSQRNVRGIDVTGSQKALDAYLKVRWIMENNSNRNVVLATGTPITNTLAEIWTMMRYVAPSTLNELGIENFDQFAANFANIDKTVEMTAGNTYKEISRLKTYNNTPALIAAFRNNADVVLSEDVKEFQKDNVLPKIAGGSAEKMIVEMSDSVRKYMKEVQDTYLWWEGLKGKEKRDLKHLPLVLYGRAKKAAVDVRLLNTVDKKYEDDPNSKLNQVVRRAYEIYKANDDMKGVTLIFCDSINSKDKSFNSHQEMKKKLIAMGVPENEIIVADDKFKGNRRMQAMQDANDGKVRFLIGSTDRLGVGLNVQKRAIAEFHVDAPPRPRDYEQRVGRILRQGNLCAVPVDKGGFAREIHIINVGVKNTLDALAYDRLSFKQFFINQILSGKADWGEMEDPTEEFNPSDLEHGQMQSLLQGSNTGMILNETKRKTRRLEAGYDNYQLKLRNLATRRNELKTLIPYWEGSRKQILQKFLEDVKNYTNEEGKVNKVWINGVEFAASDKGSPMTREEFNAIVNKYNLGAESYFITKLWDNIQKGGSVSKEAAGDMTMPDAFIKEVKELQRSKSGALGTKIENAVSESRNKAATEHAPFGRPVVVTFSFGESVTATVKSYETVILDKSDAMAFNTAMGGKVVVSDLNMEFSTDTKSSSNYRFIDSSSIISRIYPKINEAKAEYPSIDSKVENGKQELANIDVEISKPFIGADELKELHDKIKELQQKLIDETKPAVKTDELDENTTEMISEITAEIDEAKMTDEEAPPASDDEEDDDYTPPEDDDVNDVNEPPSDALYNLQQKIDGKLKSLYDSVDSEFAKMGRGGKAYLLPPKLILKGALKIIRYSVKAGFSVARAIRNALTYIKTTNWYRDQARKGNPYNMDDFIRMLNDYGISSAADIDSLDSYLKRIRKFVNNAQPGDMETALDNLTNYITQRVKSIGLSDTRLFLDAIDKIRKSQGNPARLATAITRFEQAIDKFIYREQYREAIRAKRDARRNLIKQQKFPDIRLLGMELVNLPIIKSRQRLPVTLLFKYLQAINPLAAKGRELLPDVNLIREVIREVTDWANDIETVEPEERESSEARANREEAQRNEWSALIDEMKNNFDPTSIVRHPEIDKQLQQKVREFVNIDHHELKFNQMKNYYGIMYNLYHNQLVSGHMDKDWVLPARKQQKAATVVNMKRETEFYFNNIRELAEELKRNPKTLWDTILLRPDPNMKYDAPFWQHYIQPITTSIEQFRTDYQTVKHQLDKLYDALGTGLNSRSKAAMMVRMWAFANQVDHNRPDIDFKKKLNDSIANMRESSFYSDVFEMDYLDAYNALKFTTPADDTEERVIDLRATWDSFTPAQKAFANGLHDLVEDRLQPIVQYLQMYVRGENVNFIENYHPMTILGGVNVDEAKLENQIAAMESGDGLRDAIMNTKASSMFQRTYPKKVFYSFAYQSLLGSIEGTLFDKHLTEPIREVFGAMITPTFTDAMTSDLATTLRDQVMTMLKHEIGFNELSKSTGQKIVDALIRSLTGQALVSVKRFAEYVPNWTIAAAYLSSNPYDAIKIIYKNGRDFFSHSREWLELMRNNGFSIFQRFSTHTELVDMPGGQSMILHNPFLSPLKHWKESRTTMKKYDHRNRSKFETLAFDTFNAWQHNTVRRTGDLIQQLSIGIGDYPSSFPIWVASFRQYLKDHGYDENIPVQDITTTLPPEVVTAAGNYAEKIVDKSIGVSNRGRAAEKVYSFQNEDERKAWYAYAMGRFRYFLGVLMYQQTAYAQRYASDLISGKGEYGRLKSAGITMGYLAGNMAFNVMSKLISALIIGMGGDPKEKKAQLEDLYTKEYWARNLFSAGLQLFALGKLPYFNKIIFNALAEMANKRVTENLIGHVYNSYHDALLYSPNFPLPTEWAQAKQVYNIFMPFTTPIDKLYQPVLDAMDVVGNGNPDDDALAKYNMARAALAMGNLVIQVPFINKEILNTLNQRSMAVKPSDYSSLHEQQYDMAKVKEDAQKLYDSQYSTMPKDEAMDSINFKIADPETPESERLILQQTKKVVEMPKFPLSKRQKFIHNLPAESKPAYIKEELRGATDAQIKTELQSFRDLNVISDYLYLELMDAMYYSKEQNRQEMTPKEQREYRYRAKLRENKN